MLVGLGVYHPSTGVGHQLREFFPRVTSVSGPVDDAFGCMDKNDIISSTAPHDVIELTCDLKALEADSICICSLDYVNHISCTSIGQEAKRCKGEHALADCQ